MDKHTQPPHIPMLFIRQKKHMHAICLEGQVWLCARDLGYLMGIFLDEHRARKLAPDQRKTVLLERYGVTKDTLMISESGAYMLLLYQHGAQKGRCANGLSIMWCRPCATGMKSRQRNARCWG